MFCSKLATTSMVIGDLMTFKFASSISVAYCAADSSSVPTDSYELIHTGLSVPNSCTQKIQWEQTRSFLQVRDVIRIPREDMPVARFS